MRRVKKPVFFIVAISILLLTVIVFTGVSTQYGDIKKTYINGVDDIRWGIDIRGGVDVTFTPPEGIDATDDQMNAAKEKIKLRLVNLSITDSDVFVDYNNDRIIVRFPWQAGDEDF
ncbi:MAG TPA: protein translocase subunit SecD, partial [Oscillospiraceae bacterium]|nr:protein translocase subunit SecD [Oscillospiraceae bacterium]